MDPRRRRGFLLERRPRRGGLWLRVTTKRQEFLHYLSTKRTCDHVCIDVYDCDTRTVPVMVYIGSSSVLVHRGKGRRSS